MNKQEFLAELRKGLSGLPQGDIEERVAFYSEMIDDRMEEGFLETVAVSAIGSVNDVVVQILADTPLTKLVKEKVRQNRAVKAWETVLLILGSPIWISLLIAVFAIILAIYITVWSIIISLWAIEVSLVTSAFGGIVVAMIIALRGNGLVGIAMVGTGIICAGLSIFLLFGCKAITKGLLLLKRLARLLHM